MLYYLGKGTEFKKEECKEYKTIKNALAAASKDETLTVWDETGKIIGGLTNNVPEGALKTNPDGSVPSFDENGNPVGTVDGATVAELTGESVQTATEEQNGTKSEENAPEHEKDENEENTKSQDEVQDSGNGDEQQDAQTIISQGLMKVTVVCDGTLNLRRSKEWGNENICGRASKGQWYYVKAIHTVQGKKMVQTIDDIYLSGQSGDVKFEKI